MVDFICYWIVICWPGRLPSTKWFLRVLTNAGGYAYGENCND